MNFQTLEKFKHIDRILVSFHIIRRAINKKKKIPKHIIEKLEDLENRTFPHNTKIRFTFFKDDFSKLLNAKAIPPNYVIISPEWAATLILENNITVENSFNITVGHEITHNLGDFSDAKLKNNDKYFISWINEVHADFGAAKEMANNSRNKLIQSMYYKLSRKKKRQTTYISSILEKKIILCQKL